MKLLHLANWNSTNIGNGALVFGTERVLREDIDPALEFISEPWDEYVIEKTLGPKFFDESFVGLVNAHDGLLVGGAVTFNGHAHLGNAGMRFNLPLELWQKIRKPVIFYGNSYRFWPDRPYAHADKLKAIVEYIVQAPNVFFGVRNDGTKPFLESLLGLQSEKIIEVPDPGMYVPTEDHSYPEIEEKRLNVMLSLNNEDEESRFPDARKKEDFLKALARAMERLAADFDINLILCPHHFDDYAIMSQFIGLLPPKIVHQRTISTGLLSVPKAPYFYGRYAKADLAMSMRIHSLSPAIGLGLPIVPLSSQHRVSDFLQTIGLGDMGVDVFREDAEEQIFTKARFALSNATDVRKRVTQAATLSRERTKAVNKQLGLLLKRS